MRSRLPDDQVDLVVEVFRMLADATRVQVLWALVGREMSVNDLADHIGKPAPSVSQHLAKLRMARLVRTRRDGTTIFYSLENDHVGQLVTDAVFNAEHAGPGVPGHHRDAADLATLHADTAPSRPRHEERTPRMTHDRPSDAAHDHGHDHEPWAQPRRARRLVGAAIREVFAPHSHDAVRQHRRRTGIQRRRYPRGQDQPARARCDRRRAAGDRR